MKNKNPAKKESNILKILLKVPASIRILVILILIGMIVVKLVGYEKAVWSIKSLYENITSPTGYAQSFVDPIFNKTKKETKEVAFKIGLVSDSHSNETYYPRILEKIKTENVSVLIHLGDSVDAGSIKDLEAAKAKLDGAGIPYYTVCGNHDHNFWPVREYKNYETVFGDTYYSFNYQNIHFTVINNSDEYNGLDEAQLSWLEGDLMNEGSTLSFMLMHVPPYHPFLDHTMMSSNAKVANQAKELLQLAKDQNVSEIISGHLHSFSRYIEPDSRMKISVIGSSGSQRNIVPSYAIMIIYKDGTYDIEGNIISDTE